MFAGLFQRRRQGKQFCFGLPGQRDQVGQHRPPLGDGAGLVQHDGVHLVGVFQRLGVFIQDAQLCALAGAHHDRHRGGQAQRAGAADDQHRNGPGQRKFQRLPQQQPHQERRRRDHHHHRHKHAAHLVGKLCNGRLGGAGVLHQRNDLGQGRVLPHFFGPEGKAARLVDRRGDHPVAGPFFHRDALAGNGRLVHAGHSLQHRAVHRDAHAGLNDHRIPDHNLLHGHLRFGGAPAHQRRLGRQVHQRLNGSAGAALGARFQVFAHRDQCQNSAGRFKIQVHPVAVHQLHIADAEPPAHAVQRKNAVHHRRPAAQGDQAVHVGAALCKAFKAHCKELAVHIKDGQHQKQLCERKRDRPRPPVQEMRRGQPHHVPH